MKSYQERKEDAREKARCVVQYLQIEDVPPDELDRISDYLKKLARRYGLTRELRASGDL